MRSRLTRLGVVAVGILALLGVATPPAHATTVATISFVGRATLSAPIGFPCVAGGLPTDTRLPSLDLPGTGKCNIVAWTTAKDGGLLFDPFGPLSRQKNLPNRRTFSFAVTTCLGDRANVLKGGLPTVHTGCTLTATGVVLGFCGLSQAHGTATFTDALGTITLAFSIFGVAGNLIIRGTSTSGGTFIGGARVLWPTPAQTPGQSCLNKTARDFGIVGGGVYADPTV